MVVDAEAYVARVIRYLHLTPVQAQLVQSPEAYRWSRHARYLTPRSAPPWLGVRDVLDRMGPPRVFQEFVLAGNEDAVEAFYAAGRQVPV